MCESTAVVFMRYSSFYYLITFRMIYKRILRSEIKRNVFTQENVIKNHNLKINRCSFCLIPDLLHIVLTFKIQNGK